MKYIITENRLDKLFHNYMESMYGLSYNLRSREFYDKNHEVFGYVLNNHFYYTDFSTEYSLNNMFGKTTNRLLLVYLRENFPDTIIHGVE